MIVTFISQCQKNSLNITRRILDAYANRIGERTWQTVITLEGLNAVKNRLARTARKTTAVSCHRMRGTNRTELVWIVGNRSHFDEDGNVPVNRTQRDLIREQDEDDWKFLPLIQVMVALSALFHDFGKSWYPFQRMLINGSVRDRVRHEWISLRLFRALAEGKHDVEWLDELEKISYSSFKERQEFIEEWIKQAKPPKASQDYPFDEGLPILARWIGWLIVSHHQLPALEQYKFGNTKKIEDSNAILNALSREDSGYIKGDSGELSDQDWQFEQGLPLLSKPWCRQLSRWMKKAKLVLPLIQEAMPVERVILKLARLSLKLGDHNYSSELRDENFQNDLELLANTRKNEQGKKVPNQWLDEHLVGVTREATSIAHLLPAFEKELPVARDIRPLRKPSPASFAWQNRAVQTINQWKREHDQSQQGFFAINMASTGCGKTFANAKIMSALSIDGSLRYNLALGLRTLTLQTGDEYQERLKLEDDQLAVLIGSTAVRYLHQRYKVGQAEQDRQTAGAESTASLSRHLRFKEQDIPYESAIPSDRLRTALKDRKSKQLLYAPIVVSTIDHLMPAVESTAGGREILPTLRLMSADLVIDEVDDFDQSDIPAITRLIHLAGMLGRKVMISSATIPPAIAAGLFAAYQEGWKLFALGRQRQQAVHCLWVDEFGSQIAATPSSDTFLKKHERYVQKRIKRLLKSVIKRRASILPLSHLKDSIVDVKTLKEIYFSQLRDSAIKLHRRHSFIDPETGTNLSMGVIRLANVNPCIQLSRYLLDCVIPEDVEVRVLPYHSRQVLLLRSALEDHLDAVLDRRGGKHPHQENKEIRGHLLRCKKPNLIFILVATPVEEVGRDHDLDWAVIEPSSMRSIIQMAGRILRHRSMSELQHPNLILPEFNLKGFIGKEKYVFRWPGYESQEYPLVSHTLLQLMDEAQLLERVDAAPRIEEAATLHPKERLVDLEHQALQDILMASDYRPDALNGWVNSSYFLTSLPQKLSPFRSSQASQTYKLHIEEDGVLALRFPSEAGLRGKQAPHQLEVLEPRLRERLWLPLAYPSLIEEESLKQGVGKNRICEFLGEVRLEDKEGEVKYLYTIEFGFEKH